MGFNHCDPLSKANMYVVDKLLHAIPDWNTIILERRQKFVNAYIELGRDLNAVGDKFGFTSGDMLSIFWRIQKQLQEEYNKRVEEGNAPKFIVRVVPEKLDNKGKIKKA